MPIYSNPVSLQEETGFFRTFIQIILPTHVGDKCVWALSLFAFFLLRLVSHHFLAIFA